MGGERTHQPNLTSKNALQSILLLVSSLSLSPAHKAWEGQVSGLATLDPQPQAATPGEGPGGPSVWHGRDAHALGSDRVSHHGSGGVAHCDSCQWLGH